MARRPYRTKEKLTRAQREERAQKMQVQANRGWSQWRIAKYHGVVQSTVAKILRKNLDRLEGMTEEETRTHVIQECEHYRQVIEDANRSYLRSLKDSEREEWELMSGQDGEPDEFLLKKRVREGQAGNAAFLQVILKAMRDRNELLGLVKNVTINNSNSNTNVQPVFQGVLEASPSAIEERIRAQAELPVKEQA